MQRPSTRARGATFVDYLVILGVLGLAAVVLSSNQFGLAYLQGAKRQAACILSPGEACSGALASSSGLSAAAEPSSFVAPADGSPTCDRMGNCIGALCFARGTLVATPTGRTPIEQIAVGDRVLSRDPETGAVTTRSVTRTQVTPDQPIVALEIAGAVVRTTFDHPFDVADRGWVSAGHLEPGDAVTGVDRSLTVESIAYEAERATVYNFEVEGTHTYFVGTPGALVHNACAPDAVPPAPERPATGLSAASMTGHRFDGGWPAGMNTAVRNLWDGIARMDAHRLAPQEPWEWVREREDWKAKVERDRENGIKTVPELNGPKERFGNLPTLHDYRAGWDWTRSDFFGIVVTLPPGTTPEGFLLKMQQDPHGVTGGSTDFSNSVKWDSPPDKPREVGSMVDLKMNLGVMTKGAGIMYVATVDGKPGPENFAVMTIKNDQSGFHPVNGYRVWGLTPIPPGANGGPQKYVVWTAGLDSASIIGTGTGGGVSAQNSTWRAYIQGVAENIRKSGGSTDSFMMTSTVMQPNNLSPTNTKDLRGPQLDRVQIFETPAEIQRRAAKDLLVPPRKPLQLGNDPNERDDRAPKLNPRAPPRWEPPVKDEKPIWGRSEPLPLDRDHRK